VDVDEHDCIAVLIGVAAQLIWEVHGDGATG
jgi:hypothetical protein